MKHLGPLALLVAVAACAYTTKVRAQPGATVGHTAEEARNIALTKAAFAAWRDGTGSPYDLLAEDASWTIVGRSEASRTYPSRAAFIDEVIKPFVARMREQLKPTIRSLHADGDSVVIFFDAGGIARDGLPYTNTYAWIWQMKDGKVVNAHAFFDSIAFNDLWRRVSAESAAADR